MRTGIIVAHLFLLVEPVIGSGIAEFYALFFVFCHWQLISLLGRDARAPDGVGHVG